MPLTEQASNGEGLAPFGVRHSGDSVKGKGWLGAIPNKQGDISTELSAEMQINGKTIEYPLLVPTLTKEEVDYLVSGEPPTQELYDKAESWALSRIKKGKSPFIEQEEIRFPMPSESAKYAKGGDAMYQMKKLFAEGGMMDNSGEVVNGVEVPTGSLRNEVADDIPARLSEGEFVFPADVVRYIGLETLMKLRDKAKQGLSRMEEIGQVGNAEEVANPDQMFNGEEDTTQFESDIDEIISEVDQTPQFASGGYMSGTDINKAPKNPVVDVRYFKHKTDGRTMYIVFLNGKPSSPIPDGFAQVSAKEAMEIGKELEEKQKAVEIAKSVEYTSGGENGTPDSTGATGGVTATGTAPSTGFGNHGGIVSPSTVSKGASVLGSMVPGPLGIVGGFIGKSAASSIAGMMNSSSVSSNLSLQGFSQAAIDAAAAAAQEASSQSGATPGSIAAAAAMGLAQTANIDSLDAMIAVTNSFSQGLDTTATVSSQGLDIGADPSVGTESAAAVDAAAAADDADAEGGAANAAAADAAAGPSDTDTGGFGGFVKGGLVKKRKKSEPTVKKSSKKGFAVKK